jgi:GntR family transcriptional regulator/MocR family aminotransferase
VLNFTALAGEKPGYLQLSVAIIEAVKSGRLPANSPLPPSRVLAQSVGVSRDTVLSAYRHLKNLGWVASHGTRGTFVAAVADVPTLVPHSNPIDANRLSNYSIKLMAESASQTFAPEPVIYGVVPKDCLPFKRWKTATQKNAEPLSFSELRYETAVLGHPDLRGAIAAFLNRSGGIPCTKDEVAIFNIPFNAVALICRLFLEPGDVIAMEEPGYGGVRDVAAYLGFDILPVPLDAEGISVDYIKNCGKRIKLIYVTPNHQEPTGLTMTLSRRKDLLSWAQRNNALIIEDDYDGLFHYGATMPASLKSMDTQDNVIYLASFWQLLYPLTTLCFAIIPYSFVDLLQRAKRNTASLTENFAQLALAEILDDGYLQKHVRKLERQFAVSRSSLIYELKHHFGARVELPNKTGGLTIMARFSGYLDANLIDCARQAKLALASTELFYFDRTKRAPGEFLIYFAGLEESGMRKTVKSFFALLG